MFLKCSPLITIFLLNVCDNYLGNKMTSKEAEIDLDTLLSMEIKLRLLDAEGVGVDIPQDPPPVPADPPNYEFCYDFK